MAMYNESDTLLARKRSRNSGRDMSYQFDTATIRRVADEILTFNQYGLTLANHGIRISVPDNAKWISPDIVPDKPALPILLQPNSSET